MRAGRVPLPATKGQLADLDLLTYAYSLFIPNPYAQKKTQKLKAIVTQRKPQGKTNSEPKKLL